MKNWPEVRPRLAPSTTAHHGFINSISAPPMGSTLTFQPRVNAARVRNRVKRTRSPRGQRRSLYAPSRPAWRSIMSSASGRVRCLAYYNLLVVLIDRLLVKGIRQPITKDGMNSFPFVGDTCLPQTVTGAAQRPLSYPSPAGDFLLSN